MAEQLKAEWEPSNFPNADHVDIQLYRGGAELGGIITAPVSPGVLEFFAADYPGITYAANVRGVFAWTPCSISVAGGGSGSGSGTGSGGGSGSGNGGGA